MTFTGVTSLNTMRWSSFSNLLGNELCPLHSAGSLESGKQRESLKISKVAEDDGFIGEDWTR